MELLRQTLTHNTLAPHLSLGEILTRSHILGEFVKKSEQLIQLNRTVLKLMEPGLAPYCRVQSFSHNILILSTPSPMWGHKLRFKVPDLIENLRQDPRFSALRTIQVKIIPEENPHLSTKPPLPAPKLTQESAALIQLMAKEIGFPGLQKSLLRLSMRHNN